MRHSHIAPALAVALAACVTPQPAAKTYDPFVAPRAAAAASVRRVALASIRGPAELAETDAMRGRLVATLEARLREAGLDVIPPSDLDPIFKDALGWRDGLYDPKTGKLDETRVKGVYDEVFERLADRFGGADAIVFASVRVVKATLDTDWAGWSGTTEYAGASGWKRALFLNRHSGTLRALTLVVELVGRDGNTIYADGGGIQLLEKVDPWGKRVPVDRAELLRSDERNSAAVYEATEALVATFRTRPAPQAGAPGVRPAGPAAPPARAEPPAAPGPEPASPPPPPSRDATGAAAGA